MLRSPRIDRPTGLSGSSRRTHPRESLATLLAGDSSEEQARKYLSNVLVDLRQRLGPYIRATRQTVTFDRALPYRVDVVDFQTHLEAALAGGSKLIFSGRSGCTATSSSRG